MENDGALALSRGAEPWLTVSMAPITTSRSELSLRLVNQYLQWMEESITEMPPHVGIQAPPLRAGYRRVVGNSWPEQGTGLAKGTYLQLHTDGCGFAAVALRSLVAPSEVSPFYLVHEQGVVLSTLSLMWMLSRHALDHAGAIGDAAVVTRIIATEKPAFLGRT